MTGRIDVTAPATLTVVNGGTLTSSLLGLPPYGITIADPNLVGTLSLTLVAANAGAVLSASGAAGGVISAHGNTLSVTGTQAQVNAALTSLGLQEPGGALTDRLMLTASDPAALSASTDIAVRIVPWTVPAFASPPVTLGVQPNALELLPGLVLGDSMAAGLAGAGAGQTETLAITLGVGAGILLLPGFADTGGIAAAGIGTGTLVLSFTADRLQAANDLLAQLTYVGPGQTILHYAMSNLAGPLGPVSTAGAVTLAAAGTAGTNGTFAAGGESVILGDGTGAPAVAGLVAGTGNFSGSPFIAASGTLELAEGGLTLSGTSEAYGGIGAGSLSVSGTAILAEAASIGGSVALGTGGLVDFGGALIADGNALPGQAGLSLAAHAWLLGGGTLVAGNATAAAAILGPGTLLAQGGDTLLLAAGSIGGGAFLETDGGGVLVLGPRGTIAALYGTAALAVDSSVTLDFGPDAGAAPAIGLYADSLAQQGGVIVISDPLSFGGSITGFEPGDRLVFPGLGGLGLSGITSHSFVVSGSNAAGQRESFTLNAAIPAGAALFTALDAQGDGEIGLGAGPEMFVGGTSFANARIDASAGVGQHLPGLALDLPGWTSQALTLTLSVAQGVLSDGTLAPGATLVLAAADPAALNQLLAGLVYTASLSSGGDTLAATGGAGLLAGFASAVPIVIEPGGIVSGFAQAPTDEQVVRIAGAAMTLVTQAAAPGAVSVAGAADFEDVLQAGGIGGTALSVDSGGNAIFGAGAEISLDGNAVIGDAAGAGTLGIVTGDFSIGAAGSLLVGGNAAAAGSAVEVTGALDVSGAILLGQSAASRLELAGVLDTGGTTLGSAGTLLAGGGASAAFGGLVDAGTLVLADQASATAQQLVLSGQLTLGGNARLTGLASAIIASGGTLAVAADAALDAFALEALGGSVQDSGTLQVAGNLLSDAAIDLAGGTLAAAAVTIGAGLLGGAGAVVANRISLAGGELLASGGTLALDGNVTMSGGTLEIAGGAALDLIRGAAGAISFGGAGAVLTVNDIAEDSAAVSGMLAGDVIDLVGVAPSLVSATAGTVSAKDGGGNALGGFALGTGSLQPGVSIVSDGAGGALITLGGDLACFARGTRLLTPNGYVPVEAFKPGDPVITRFGIRRGIRWIGRRGLELGPLDAVDMRPVTILPGAFGPLLPSRKIRLSPAHAVLVNGVLVPAMHLVNGATILREKRPGSVTYYHVELDRHDILLAEGLPVESYIDTGNRAEFGWEAGIRGGASKPCAPLVTAGPKLQAIRRLLHQLALQAGFSLTRAPMLRGVAGDAVLAPDFSAGPGLSACFRLPPGTDRLTLLAPEAAPAETDPDSDDRRALAICIRPGRRMRLGQGWHPKAKGDAGRWMSGNGEILLPPGTAELRFGIAAIVQSWRRPVDSGYAAD